MPKPGDNPDDIAIIGWNISPMERHTSQTEAQLLNQVITGAVADAGITRKEVDFTCAGSCDYVAGQAFSFVQNIDSDSASDAIVQAMVDLARGIGVEVTAEGVETNEQRNYLAKIGCHELQGFLLSRPLAPDQIDEMLADDLPREIATAA